MSRAPRHCRQPLFAAPQQEGLELVHELEQVVEGEVRFDGYSRMLYSTDASQYQIQPLGVVIPRKRR